MRWTEKAGWGWWRRGWWTEWWEPSWVCRIGFRCLIVGYVATGWRWCCVAEHWSLWTLKGSQMRVMYNSTTITQCEKKLFSSVWSENAFLSYQFQIQVSNFLEVSPLKYTWHVPSMHVKYDF